MLWDRNPEQPVECIMCYGSSTGSDEMLFRTSSLTVVVAACFAQPSFKPRIPTIWEDREIAEMEIPVSNPAYSPHHVSAEYYYRIPVRPIYRTYPVYAPGRAPQGYLDSLREKEPEIVFMLPTCVRDKTGFVREKPCLTHPQVTTIRSK